MSKREYLVDGVFAAGSVNIICGPSGAGKTTLMFQSLQDWLRGDEVFGRASIQDAQRRKLFYIAADRDEDDVQELLDRIHVTGVNYISILDSTDIGKYLAAVPADTSFVYIDGASILVPGGRINDNDTVFKFLRGLRAWAKSRKVAILLSCHSPKRWKGEELINPRESILGSIAWGAGADTVMIMQEDNPRDDNDTTRTLVLESRHAKKKYLRYKYDETVGRLVELPSFEEQTKKVLFLATLTIGECYSRKNLVEHGLKHGFSTSTVDRLLKGWLKDARLEKTTGGEYVVPGKILP